MTRSATAPEETVHGIRTVILSPPDPRLKRPYTVGDPYVKTTHRSPLLKPCTRTTMSPPKLPTFDELPKFEDFTGCAWGVWGKEDELGTVNLLTEEVVKEAAQEIK